MCGENLEADRAVNDNDRAGTVDVDLIGRGN